MFLFHLPGLGCAVVGAFERRAFHCVHRRPDELEALIKRVRIGGTCVQNYSACLENGREKGKPKLARNKQQNVGLNFTKLSECFLSVIQLDPFSESVILNQ